MTYLKILYFYFIHFVNALKFPIIMSVIALGTFLNREGFENTPIEYKVVFSDPIFGGKMYNNYYHTSRGVGFVTHDEKLDIVKSVDEHPLNIIQWVLFGFSLFFFLGWFLYIYIENVQVISDTEKRVTKSLSTLEKDDKGDLCYVCIDRVIHNPSRLYSDPDLSYFPEFSDLRFYPIFSSKSRNRLKSLSKIGI
jgi:hypothetical protein